jgi:hypothetical protein
MLRTFKILGWSGLLLASLSTARAYSLLGPVSVDTWQVPELGYMLAGDLGAPKDSGQEYRWNIPTLYYSFDQNFLTYFGSNGVRAVSQAFNAFNALTNASAVELSKFPVAVKRQNYRAQADGLLDLKSYTMELLIEQLGLADPIRYAWTLHNRYFPAGVTCPGSGIMYLVVNRNFDVNPSALDQAQPSSRVNGVFYTYQIVETCIPPNPLAWAEPISPDPYYTYAPVASMRALTGDFYIGLTRDDASGLRYLFSSNNINFEAVSPGVDLLVTNPPVFLSTSNLVQLVSDTSTNNPAALQALYPSLQFVSSPAQYTNQVTTNYTFYYTNYAWTAGGAVPVLVSLTNYTTNIGTFYQYQFLNVVTNPGPPSYTISNPPYTNSYVTIIYTNIVAGPYVTPDQVVTNVYVTNVNVSALSGDYYIIPTNACGGLVVASNQLSLLVLVTNATEFIPAPQLLITNPIDYFTTSNLTQLISDSTTNGPAALQALYPSLQITNYTRSFTNLVTVNLTPFYTNYPWGIPGQPPVVTYATNYSTNIGFVYQYKFGNVVTSSYSPRSLMTVLITNVTQFATNVYFSNYWANVPSGDYYIMPTNNGCGSLIVLSNILSQVFAVTNGTAVATNQPGSPWGVGGSVFTNYYYSETTFAPFTNHNFAYFLITCYSNQFASSLTRITYFTNRNLKAAIVSCETSNAPALRRGIEKVSFIRRDFDSLLGQAFQPATNFFPMVVVRGNTNAYQTYRRIVTAPDFLMTAQDFTPGPAAIPISLAVVRTIPNFDAANKQPNLAGPGTINPPVQFAYNRAGVVLQNVSPFVSGRGSSFFTWGSFDGTANPPIYYPNGTSTENLENQIIMQITTTNLPAGKVGTAYASPGPSVVQLTGSGGQPPYVWSQSQFSAGLPPGLSVFSDGTILGIPTLDGVYDIIIRMTDAYARYVEQPFTIVVNP